jgi:hypothetical protein
MTTCPKCQGRGWLTHNSWPVECMDCTPTKIVRGKVTLDKSKVAAIERAKHHEQSIAPQRYQGNGTTHYFAQADTE